MSGTQGNTRMMVDAEHSHFQPVIDALALRLQQRCNRAEPIILNTYQVRRVCRAGGESSGSAGSSKGVRV